MLQKMLLLALTLLSACSSAPHTSEKYLATTITPALLAKSLQPAHPRLFLTDVELAALKAQFTRDPQLDSWYRQLEKNAEKLLLEPSISPKADKEKNLTEVRRSLKIILNLAGLYRFDHDARKLERARKELLAAAALSHWNTAHFLDVGELSFAVGVGYDWLYPVLSPDERATIRQGLIDRGLNEGLKAQRENAWWTAGTTNWVQVCNGGLSVAALAVAEDAPELAAELLDRSYHSVQHTMTKFAPDGGDPEGNMYWNYGSRYNVFFIAALQSALGSDFTLVKTPGFSKTGFFNIQTIDPLRLRFNFSDSDEDPSPAPQMLWLAREFNEPVFAEHERRISKDEPTIFHLVWSLGAPVRAHPGHPELHAWFQATHVATFRSQWDDTKALYVGFKGGDNKANHSHLDLGSFVLDLNGVRWALDLGGESYDLPGYFKTKGPRWTYFRTRNEGHNTLTLDDENQSTSAEAPITKFSATRSNTFAVAELTAAYASKVRSAKRGVRVLPGKRVLIQDELELRAPAAVRWQFLTHAQIELNGSSAILSQAGERLKATVLSPNGARFTSAPAAAPAPQLQNIDVNTLRVELKQGPGPVQITVLLEPATKAAAPRVKLKKLASW